MGCDDVHSGPNLEELAFDERVKKMRERLKKTPLSEFTADYAWDICLVMSGRTITEYHWPIEQALKRLEEFFSERA